LPCSNCSVSSEDAGACTTIITSGIVEFELDVRNVCAITIRHEIPNQVAVNSKSSPLCLYKDYLPSALSTGSIRRVCFNPMHFLGLNGPNVTPRREKNVDETSTTTTTTATTTTMTKIPPLPPPAIASRCSCTVWKREEN
ncbi:hypothetical protein ALC62_10821, partial [Cyphomyrmex costatus]